MRSGIVVLGCVVLLAGLAQLVQPPALGPFPASSRTVWADPRTPAEVKPILRRACADCHSALTRWPWYSHVSPVSWLIWNDVRRGRAKLDLSGWPRNPSNELQEIGDEIARGSMPPDKYRLMHPEARLTARDRSALLAWTAPR